VLAAIAGIPCFKLTFLAKRPEETMVWLNPDEMERMLAVGWKEPRNVLNRGMPDVYKEQPWGDEGDEEELDCYTTHDQEGGRGGGGGGGAKERSGSRHHSASGGEVVEVRGRNTTRHARWPPTTAAAAAAY
jgi:hypothetical protein